ncbi:MAG: glycosyltransferase [Bryobacteraceae bacterium]|nr:glycosyltransferase [Bryobacteraceae bacterium]
MKERPRVLAMWDSLGPCHHARLNALSDQSEVSVIEVRSRDDHRGWGGRVDEYEPSFEVIGLNHGGSAWSPTLLAKVIGVVRSRHFDGVLVPGYTGTAALALAVWAKTKKWQTILLTDSTLGDKKRQTVAEILKRCIVARLFDVAIVSGRRAAAYAERLGFDTPRRGYYCDVVDNDWFARMAAEARGSGADIERERIGKHFLYVGRLAPEKNLVKLIEAFAKYREMGGTWDLNLIGTGPMLKTLLAVVVNSQLVPCVHFLGARVTSDLPGHYARAEALILPSKRETWGLVVNEAMACQLPILVSERCGCADDLVEPDGNGWTFDPLVPGGLAALMLRMERLPDVERQRLGNRSRTLIAGYSPRAFADEVVRMLGVDTR